MPTDTLARLQLPKRAFAVVLAGGRGARLKQLTDHRAKPAVYFGGKFRVIDFALSNCLNSGIKQIGVATQYQSHSLLRHLQRGWSFLKTEMNEFIDLLPAQQRVDETSWYRGTADAVLQNLHIIRSSRPQLIVVLAGDHIYKMDYSLLLTDHVACGAQCTVACIEVPIADATGFGVLAADRSRRITDFVEKPANPPAMQDKPDRALASMGVYVFNAQYLYDALAQDITDPNSRHDFGGDIVPRAVHNGEAVAHPFGQSCVTSDANKEPYWRDVGTIDAYWEANIDLTAVEPLLDIYDRTWPILTYQEQLPPAKFIFNLEGRRGMALNSLVSGGCIISGASIENSLLFSKCRINSYCKLYEAVLLPEVTVGRHTRLTRVVIDHGCSIPEGTVIGEDPAEDARRFERTEKGVTLVTREMLACLG
ncbi:MAG: glucose-1-phosphate adenylyltransferase [Betaproteobacteria bacterium]|nr:glucose-1-phosphate adenylyltransferase [Betaproteobacteria bacterium]